MFLDLLLAITHIASASAHGFLLTAQSTSLEFWYYVAWSPPSVLVYKARINHLLIPTSVGAAKPEREKAACTKYYLHIQKCVATTKSQITVLNNNKFMYILYKHIFGIDYNNLHLSWISPWWMKPFCSTYWHSQRNATGAFIITFPTFYQSHWEQRQLNQPCYSEDY